MTVKRLIKALANGQECCETILNYRRDGSPFVNLLLLAPLYDNKGHVRYFLGAQIDVSPLVEAGRGLESFSQLLAQDRSESRFGGRSRDPSDALGEFGELLNEDETNVIRNRTRRSSEGTQSTVSQRPPTRGRRILGMEDAPSEKAMWPHPNLGPSGRLPGVYQNYLLVRPYPSLRITFTSPALRIPGLLQTKFLDRIGGPQHVRESVLDALSNGMKVTAKVTWLTGSGASGMSEAGKPRWLHCTPLLGSDEKVGVWMVVMVENEEVTGSLNRQGASTVGSPSVGSGGGGSGGAVSSKFTTGNKLYAEYLRREGSGASTANAGGRPITPGTAGLMVEREGSVNRSTPLTAMEQREMDRQFKDF